MSETTSEQTLTERFEAHLLLRANRLQWFKATAEKWITEHHDYITAKAEYENALHAWDDVWDQNPAQFLLTRSRLEDECRRKKRNFEFVRQNLERSLENASGTVSIDLTQPA